MRYLTRIVHQYIQLMKKVFLSLLLAGASVVGVRAQSNTLLVYGNVNVDSQKAGNTTVNSSNFSPGVGYQWNNNWTAGINLGLSGRSSTSNSITVKSSDVSVGPFVRYTQPLAGVFSIYGQFNANFLSGKSYSGFQGTIFPAIGVNLKNNFALNFTFGSLSYTSLKADGDSDATTTFHFGFGTGAGFGISKNFGLKK